jgi:hypothetical protein
MCGLECEARAEAPATDAAALPAAGGYRDDLEEKKA